MIDQRQDGQGHRRRRDAGQVLGLSRCSPAATSARARIFGLGIMPYISASIIFQLLGQRLSAAGKAAERRRERPQEDQRIHALRHRRHLPDPGVHSGSSTSSRRRPNGGLGLAAAGLRHWLLTCMTSVITMTAGTVFLMWLGEQIDEYGIGNGISLIIMAGIVARIPDATAYAALRDTATSAAVDLHARRRRRRRHQLREAARADLPVRRRGGRRDRHHQGPAAHPDAVGQARARPARLRRHPPVPAAEGQPGGRHAGHLRQQLADPARSSSSSGCTPALRLELGLDICATPSSGRATSTTCSTSS